jgi:hypothetical protein
MLRKAPPPRAAISDPEAHAVLVQAMAEVGADPALVYAFQRTGIYVCEENEKRLPKAKLAAFEAAVEEYYTSLNRGVQ